ncbi:MAG: hypothetical protein H7A35_03725 [Planctomycetales bacterium]|nr:hypothetical protein [bacterium]UNM09165.1 MAG: hypothetical protein H7A35_03725 [Planctomycetales bacterium]
MKDFIRRHRRLLQVLLALLLLLPLMRLLWITRVVPTGDALYDRYQSAWLARKRWGVGIASLTLRTDRPPSRLYCAIDDGVLASWEQDFGEDPRYWELRYFNEAALAGRLPRRLYNRDQPEPADSYLSDPAVQHLATALDTGVADGHLLDLLAVHRYTSMYRHHSHLLEQASGRQDSIDRNRALEQDQLELLDSAIAANPGSAWPYYDKFIALSTYGVDSELVELLEQANQLPCQPRLPFPLSFIEPRLASGDIGNPILAGSILEVQQHLVFDNWSYLEMKDVMKELLVVSPDIGMERSFDACYQFALRPVNTGSITEISHGCLLANVALQIMTVDAGDGLDGPGRQQLYYQSGLLDGALAAQLQWQEQARFEHPDAWYELYVGWLEGNPELKYSYRQNEFKPLAWRMYSNGCFEEPELGVLRRWSWKYPQHRYPALAEYYSARRRFSELHFEPFLEKLRGYHIGQYDERNYHQGIDQ